MTNTPKPSQEASEAWQDVQVYTVGKHDGMPAMSGDWYARDDVEKARAADAQQIAELTRAVQGNALAVVKANENAAQQIVALTDELRGRQCAEHPQAGMAWACEECYGQQVLELQQQIAPLRAELAGWIQARAESFALHVQMVQKLEQAEAQLTALQAEQETPR